MKILIVGGGSAGWMTASYLVVKNKMLDITLIESSNVPIIGVGESTIPSIVDFMEHVGITEQDLFKHCSAVRKYTIQHNGWNNLSDIWYHRFCDDESQELDQDNYMNQYTVNPRKHSHAYHLDATKFGSVCRDKSAIPNGVKHVIDDIVDVISDENGIKELVGTKNKYTADLYIDCTGFKALLRSKFKTEYKKHPGLVNNCAIAGPGEYKLGENPLPYTQTFSMNNGWRWRIGLQHRTGNGYVFNKDQISIEDAKKEFIEKTPGIIKDKIFVVPFRNGYNPEPWMHNVVCMGLSSGFLEPLESTGLFLVHGPVMLLEKLLNDPKGSKKFNKIWASLYSHIGNFVSLHYKTSNLNHTDYWRNIDKVNYIEYPNKPQAIFNQYSYRCLANSRGLSYN